MAPATTHDEDAAPRSPRSLLAGTPKAQAITELIAAVMQSQQITVSNAKIDEELRLIPTRRDWEDRQKSDIRNAGALEEIKLVIVGDHGVGKRKLLLSCMGTDYTHDDLSGK